MKETTMINQSTKQKLDKFFNDEYYILFAIAKKIINKNSRPFRTNIEDVIHYIYIDLMYKPDWKINHLIDNKQLRFFIVDIIYNSITSTTSGFQRFFFKLSNGDDAGSFLKLLELESHNIEYVDPYEKELYGLSILEKDFKWWEKEIFTLLCFDNYTFKSLETKTRIPASALHSKYKEMKDKIRKEINIKYE